MPVRDLLILLLAGLSFALPHIAHASGHTQLARRLEAAPRLFIGVVALLVASSPQSVFRYVDEVGTDGGAAPLWLGRIAFGGLGLYLLVTAVRRGIKPTEAD